MRLELLKKKYIKILDKDSIKAKKKIWRLHFIFNGIS